MKAPRTKSTVVWTTDYADFTDEALAFAQVVFKICFRNLPQPSQSLGTFNLQLATCNVQPSAGGVAYRGLDPQHCYKAMVARVL